MNERIIEKEKRFVPIQTYCQMTGLSYATVDHMLKSGQLRYITTEGGLRRIDTRESGIDQQEVIEKMGKMETMLSSLCKLFNITPLQER
jgi:predicted site-specific integrase-resolvase